MHHWEHMMVRSVLAVGGFINLVSANLTVEMAAPHRPPLISIIFISVMHGREYLYNFAPWANASKLAILAVFSIGSRLSLRPLPIKLCTDIRGRA